MKRLLIAAGIVALITIGCSVPKPVPPPALPLGTKVPGCSVLISSIAGRVSAMTWTNASTGHSGSGVATISPELGSSGSVFSDPSVSCPTNQAGIPIAGATFVCHGTNMPYAQLLTLAYNSDGLHFLVSTGDCATCSGFSVTKDADYWCNIYAPKK